MHHMGHGRRPRARHLLVCHQYVHRREPLRLRGAEGAQLFNDTTLSYRARLGTSGGSARMASCGYAPEAIRRDSTNICTSLYWRRD